MKTTLKVVLSATLLAATAGAAKADLTFQGAVGLPLNPTAQIPLQGGARIQGNYLDIGEDSKFYGLHGAVRVASTLEINGGVDRLDLDGNGNNNLERTGLTIGAKYLITRETDPAGVRLAVGGGYSRALLKNYHAYAVATKSLGDLTNNRVPITGHLGLRYDHFENGNFGNDDSNKVSIFAGVEVPVTRRGDFTVVGELQSKNNELTGAKVPFSASVRFRPPGQGFSASLGVARQGLSNHSGLYAQIGYSFDTGKIVKP